MRKLHALRAATHRMKAPLPYETTVNWTLCQRYVEREQIAAFEDGVTCKSCRNIRNIIDFNNKLFERGRKIIEENRP